jgi:enhancing lycopene biosynthesis protein 2
MHLMGGRVKYVSMTEDPSTDAIIVLTGYGSTAKKLNNAASHGLTGKS